MLRFALECERLCVSRSFSVRSLARSTGDGVFITLEHLAVAKDDKARFHAMRFVETASRERERSLRRRDRPLTSPRSRGP